MMDYQNDKFFNVLFKGNRNLPVRDYDFGLEENSSYINSSIFNLKYYEVKDNYIIVYYSYHAARFPYSRELEKVVLEKMKKQVEESKDVIDSKVRRDGGVNGYASISFSILSLFLSNAYYSILLFSEPESPILMFLGGTSWLVNSGLWGIPTLKTKLLEMDYKKNKLFLENEDKINGSLEEKMPKLGPINRYSVIPTTHPVTINDIHFLGYRDVLELSQGRVSKKLAYKLKK